MIISPFDDKDVDDWMLFQKVILKVIFDKIKSHVKITYNLVVV